MSIIVKKATAELKAIKELLLLALELLKLFKQYPAFFIVILLLVSGYYGLVRYTYTYPGETIESFYSELNGEKYENAWRLIDPNLQESFDEGSLDYFKSGYSSTMSHKNVIVEYRGDTTNPIKDLRNNTRTYHVSFLAHDRFTKDDLQHEIQWKNRLWLQITDNNEYENLTKGNRTNPLNLRRYYKQKIDLIKKDGSWRISSINDKEVGHLIDTCTD